MISNFTIRSKVNVKPQKKVYIFTILLNICLAVVMIAGIIKILFDGFDVRTLGTMALAFVIVTLYKKRPSNTEHYEFALVDATITDNELTLLYRQIESYKNRNIRVRVQLNKITALEFSNQLCCLHICGQITSEVVGNNGKAEQYAEHFLYLEQGMEREFIASIQNATGVSIKYMDR